MTSANYKALLDAISETRSDVNDVRSELLSRLDRIDERLRRVEVSQGDSANRTVELSNKWKAGIATGIASGLAALIQALLQK